MTHPEVLRLIEQLRAELGAMILLPTADGRQITALDVVSRNLDTIKMVVHQHWEICPVTKGRHRGVWSVTVVDEPQFPVIWECEECGAVIDDPDVARARRMMA